MKRMIFGMFLTTLSAIYSLVLLVTAADHPISFNGHEGMYANLRGNGLFIPFLVSAALVLIGIIICLLEAYRKPNR